MIFNWISKFTAFKTKKEKELCKQAPGNLKDITKWPLAGVGDRGGDGGPFSGAGDRRRRGGRWGKLEGVQANL